MNKYLVVLIHILYWTKLSYVYMLIFGWPVTGLLVFYDVLPDVANCTAFYIAYFLLVPHLLAHKKFVQFGIAALATLALSCTLGWSTFLLLKNYFHFKAYPKELASINRITVVLYLDYSLKGLFYGSLMKAFFTWYSDIRVKEELKKKNMQTELALLKAQLNPHFLFNTLNNIDNLIARNADAASNYLNKLSGILRFTLYEASGERILLSKELDHIQQYIDLQRLRTSNTKFVRFEVEGEPGGLQIAPMLFTPFIENAFKYSTNKKIEYAIDIHLAINEGALHFTCSNAIIESLSTSLSKAGGLGMEIIKKRLKLLYPGHDMQVDITDSRYTVTLKLMLRDN